MTLHYTKFIIIVMAEWHKRAKKNQEVIFFSYPGMELAGKSREVYLWDVDKTYLDTKFETFRGLLRTATEKAKEKKNIPGSAELVRSLKLAWKKRRGGDHLPIFFITASPPQMEKKIKEKLSIDGVEPYGIFCKDQLPNLRPQHLWKLSKHVGYKLQALLELRKLLAEDVRMILFGDDGESDTVIYSLFSDICSRRLDTSELRKVLNSFFVLDDQVDLLFRLQDEIPKNDPVEKVYINLADDTDADYYLKFGRRTLPTSSSLQMAIDLYQDDRLDLEHVGFVARNLEREFGYTLEEIEKIIDDLIRRGVLCDEACKKVLPFLAAEKLIHSEFTPSIPPRTVTETRGKAVINVDGNFEPWVPEHIDYLHDDR